jgi:hypothetical protein
MLIQRGKSMKTTSFAFSLAAAAAVGVATLAWSPNAQGQIITFTGSVWSSPNNNSSICNAEPGSELMVPCNAAAAAPGYFVFNDGSPPHDHALFELGGQLLPGFYYPFVCDPAGNCPAEIQVSGTQQSLTIDQSGNVWWIDSGTGHVHYMHKLDPYHATDVDVDATNGQNIRWASIGVGATQATSSNPSTWGQVWGVSTSGAVYQLDGMVRQDGSLLSYGWWQMPGVPGGATSIALMNNTAPSGCSANWHVPWALGGGGQIYQFVQGSSASCYLDGYWQALPGGGLALAADNIVLGGTVQNPVLYQWRGSQFDQVLAPPLAAGATIVNVGARVSWPTLAGGYGGWGSIAITDSQNNIWYESCGTFGC